MPGGDLLCPLLGGPPTVQGPMGLVCVCVHPLKHRVPVGLGVLVCHICQIIWCHGAVCVCCVPPIPEDKVPQGWVHPPQTTVSPRSSVHVLCHPAPPPCPCQVQGPMGWGAHVMSPPRQQGRCGAGCKSGFPTVLQGLTELSACICPPPNHKVSQGECMPAPPTPRAPWS